jgi:gluconolactonase
VKSPTEPLIPIERFEVFASGLDHPECVAFDRDGNLWAGGEAGQVYKITPDAKVQQIASLGSFNAGLAFSPNDELIVCNPARGVVRVRADGTDETFASHAGERKLICANFGVFKRNGDYFVTDSGQWKKNNGALCRFTPDGRGQVIAEPFGYANGLALASDERTLFMVESDFNRVWRFGLDSGGNIIEREVFAENIGRLPDGLALDSAENLYASCYASDDIYRIDRGGEEERFAYDQWAILLSRPTNMAFGVRDGDRETMYVANLGRQTITRAKVGVTGQLLANWQK